MSGRMLALRGRLGTKGVAAILASIVALAGLSACSRDKQASSPRSYQVSATDFRYHGFPSSIEHGLFQVSFTNREGFPFRHELVVVRLQPGQNAQSIVDDVKARAADSEDDWLHFGEIADVDTGSTLVGTFDLQPGTYALACWQDGQPGGGVGEIHAGRGMVYTFTVR